MTTFECGTKGTTLTPRTGLDRATSSVYEGYEFVPAAHYGTGRAAAPTIIVVHTIEQDQTPGMEDAVAQYFHTQAVNAPNPTSAHGIVGASKLIRLVKDEDTAYHCGTHGNIRGLGLEHVGRAENLTTHKPNTAAYWNTPYTGMMLDLSAEQIAIWCHKYGIPPVRLTPADLLAGRSGICGHVDVHDAWPADTSHWDPGPAWPWAKHLALIQAAYEGDTMSAADVAAINKNTADLLAAYFSSLSHGTRPDGSPSGVGHDQLLTAIDAIAPGKLDPGVVSAAIQTAVTAAIPSIAHAVADELAARLHA